MVFVTDVPMFALRCGQNLKEKNSTLARDGASLGTSACSVEPRYNRIRGLRRFIVGLRSRIMVTLNIPVQESLEVGS